MSLARLTRIAVHDAPGEMRAAALDADGLAWRLFSQRWNGVGEAVRRGQVVTGRLRAIAEGQGGAFIQLDTGQEAYLAGSDLSGTALGMVLGLKVKAEARLGKLARVVLCDDKPGRFDAFVAWVESLPGAVELGRFEDNEIVEAAFDEALCHSAVLRGGGYIYIEPTRALTAIDIDTAGRIGKGSAGARALSINRDGAIAAARQIALRDIGGAVVLDCTGPLNKAAGEQVRARFLEALALATRRKVQVLVPSQFGLMQAAIEWGACPLADRVLADPGQMQLLAGLRDTEREAKARGADLLRLELSQVAHTAYLDRKSECDCVLAQRFGGRVSIALSDDDKTIVRRR